MSITHTINNSIINHIMKFTKFKISKKLEKKPRIISNDF